MIWPFRSRGRRGAGDGFMDVLAMVAILAFISPFLAAKGAIPKPPREPQPDRPDGWLIKLVLRVFITALAALGAWAAIRGLAA